MKLIIVRVAFLMLCLSSSHLVNADVNLISSDSSGIKGNGQSTRPNVNADGRFVVFVSSASNLKTVPGSQVFVKDTLTQELFLVSRASDGTPGNANSSIPITISADGRYVTFLSFASNLAPNDTNGRYDQFWHDRVTGETRMINVAPDGTPSNDYADFSTTSGDGRYVAFRSSATNLVTTPTSGNQVYLRDMQLETTRLISRNSSGSPQGGGEPDISYDGSRVVYRGVPLGVYVVDTTNCDAIACNVVRADVNNLGNPVSGHTSVLFPKISGNGQFVTWESNAPGYVDGDTNGTADIFVRDIAAATTSRVTIANDGAQADSFSYTPDISDDGRYVSFTSNATNLTGPDGNGVLDVFVRDRQQGQTVRLTVAGSGQDSNGLSSYYARISGNGNAVVFSSLATNLAPEDTDTTEDVYMAILTPPNGAPVAEAGESIEVPVGERVTLNGLNSSDDSDVATALSYAWTLATQPQGSTSTLNSTSSFTSNLTPDMPGTYRIDLVVTDTQGASSTPDSVEIVAGIVPGYVFKNVAQGTQSYSRNGSDYFYENDYPIAFAADNNEIMFSRYTSSYDSTTRISTSSYSLEESDGTTTSTRLARGQALSPTDELVYWSEVRRMPDAAIKFSGAVYRFDGSVNRYIRGAWELDQNDNVTSLFEFPLTLASQGRSIPYGFSFRFSDNVTGFASYTSPRTYKEWDWTDSQGVTRTSRYYDQEVYTVTSGQVEVLWDTTGQIPDVGEVPYWINIQDVNENGDVLIRAGYPRGPSTNRWDSALIRVNADGSVSTIFDSGSSSAFADYSLYQAEFDGDDVLATLSGSVNGRWEQSIYRDSGTGLQRFIAGPYLSAAGSSSYSYLYTWGYSSVNGDFLFNGYPNLLARIDGRIRTVATRGDEFDGITPDYINAYTYYNNDLLDSASVGFNGQTQTLRDYVSSNDYAYEYDRWVFHAKLDTDRDLVADSIDNCPVRPNTLQDDTDGNGIGDLCEDSDADGIDDIDDNCPLDPNANQLNSDTDPYGDACDVCDTVNDDQSDQDDDGEGDACDTDIDGDLVANSLDNCPLVFNAAPQSDIDSDGKGDACDPDKDDDGIANEVDGTYDGAIFTDESGFDSNRFTDQHRGGSSFGTLLGNNSNTWTVEDGTNNSVGLLISSDAQARLRSCGESKPVTWPGGATIELTCTSTSVRTLLGLVEVSVDDQEDIVVSVPQGADVRIVDEPTGEFAVIVSQLSSVPVEVQLGGNIRLEVDTSTAAIIEEPEPGQFVVSNSAGSDGIVMAVVDGKSIVYGPGDDGIGVIIDIKPGSESNTINLGSKGNVPVAILSSSVFDATAVDPLTVSLSSAAVGLRGKGTPQVSADDVNGDGIDDLVVHIDTSALDLSPESSESVLIGTTYDGKPIRGSDSVIIVP